jgi:hypothetical protein
MTLDTAITLCAFVLVLIVPTYLLLEVRAVRRGLQQLHHRQRQHAGAIIQLQTTVADTPLQVHQPMPTVGRPKAEPAAVPPGWASLTSVTPGRPTRVTSGDIDHDPDETMRLRPPALSDIEAVLAKAARPLTRMEMAAELERQPWELLGDLKRLMLDGRLALTPSHGAEAAYTLADPTTRMASMPILWGAR